MTENNDKRDLLCIKNGGAIFAKKLIPGGDQSPLSKTREKKSNKAKRKDDS